MKQKVIKYYCREHSFDRSKRLRENKGLCQAMGGCGMLAVFEIEESYNELMKDIQKLKNYDTSGDDLTR